MGMGFLVNHELIERVLLHRKPGDALVVWSGGGADYAHAVVSQYCPRLDRCVFSLKDLTTLKWIAQGDIVVDDDTNVRARQGSGSAGIQPTCGVVLKRIKVPDELAHRKCNVP